MSKPKIVIGARGSKLSLIQTEIVKKKLQTIFPDTEIIVQVITTKGDKDMNPVPLDSIGKGWFTKEIDNQLLEGKIDLAVHSLKDLPETLTEGLIISAIIEREDPRDVLVSKANLDIDQLKKGAIIGTDSSRRASLVLHQRPDLVVKSLRGNVNTRLEKLESEDYDAIILASAGLKRLGLEDQITQYFEPTDFIPSPGQGALAVVSKKDHNQLNQKLKLVIDQDAAIAVEAERAFSSAIGGGCKMPVGAYAVLEGANLTLYGFIGSTDGVNLAKDSVSGKPTQATDLGQKLAQKLLVTSSSWQTK